MSFGTHTGPTSPLAGSQRERETETERGEGGKEGHRKEQRVPLEWSSEVDGTGSDHPRDGIRTRTWGAPTLRDTGDVCGDTHPSVIDVGEYVLQ